MYQSSYAEILEDDQAAARRVEFMALDRAVELLRRAAEVVHLSGQPAAHLSREGIEALHLVRQLWMTLIGEAAAPENALPAALRANLISIGIWILKEAERIRLGLSRNYSGIADVCASIRDGLR